jgi:DNA-binding NtrC family response regulator
LISATNLPDEKLRERLDPDFFDRISMLTLRMPPLREIPEEIPWLWEMVFAQAAHRAGSGRVRLPASAHRAIVDQLSGHPLPGNLRDLFRVAYRTIAARVDQHSPLSAADASEYGLTGWKGLPEIGADALPKAVALAFAESTSLEPLVASGELDQYEGDRESFQGLPG